MKKTNLKSALIVAAIAFSCFGAWKAFDTYNNSNVDNNSMLFENIEALSSGSDVEGLLDIYDVRGDERGICVKFTSTHAACPERGTDSNKHGRNCEIITYSYDKVGVIYEKKQVKAWRVPFNDKWRDEYGKCPSGSTSYKLDEEVTVPAPEHTYEN